MNHKQVALGERNRAAVRAFFASHLCATQRECAEALGLADMAVNRHVRAIRLEWRKPKFTLEKTDVQSS